MDSAYHVSEYCANIQSSMLKREDEWAIDGKYMMQQTKMNETIRTKLIDWLLQTHYNFRLLPESLFLTCNILDRFFSSRQIGTREVQLVAMASMLIATKYEEIYPPSVKDCVHISECAFTEDEIKDMELEILAAIDFNL